MKTLKLNEKDIQQAAELIQRGEIVAFPTETVYGLGADASNEMAVEKVFEAKGRPADRPLSVLVNNKNALKEYAENVPIEAKKLVETFWPGALTIILQKKNYFAPSVTMGKETIGLRMPDHPVALRLIELSQRPLATPSANSSGRPSPTTAGHVFDDLEGKVAAIIDGGPTSFGIESTIIDLTNPDEPVILRTGEISKKEIERTIDKKVALVNENNEKHYTPEVPVFCVSTSWEKAIREMNDQKEKIGILASDKVIEKLKDQKFPSFSLGSQRDGQTAKNNFYNGLRTLEKEDITVILAEVYSNSSSAEIYMNRLKKAANNKEI